MRFSVAASIAACTFVVCSGCELSGRTPDAPEVPDPGDDPTVPDPVTGIPGETAPWSGVGSYFEGSSAELVALTSPRDVSLPGYVLTGTADPAVLGVTVALNGGAPIQLVPLDGAFAVALELTPGFNHVRMVATDAWGERAALIEAVRYASGQPSSAALIADALASGAISADEALQYRVFALFGDERLPAAYRGDDSFADGSATMAEVAARLPTLPEATRAVVEPFFVPEFYAPAAQSGALVAATAAVVCLRVDAGCVLSGDWKSVGGAHVRIWYDEVGRPLDLALARQLVPALDVAWERLRTAMRSEPRSDDGIVGGDALLDIVLTPRIEVAALTLQALPFMVQYFNPSAAFIRVNPNLTSVGVLGSAVHELMHAFQWGRTLADPRLETYHTLAEGTAAWATHQVVPAHGHNRLYAYAYLDHVGDVERGLLTTFDLYDVFPYGTWLFFQYLSDRFGDGVIGDLWDVAQNTTSQHEMLKTAIGRHADLGDVWRDFAVALWNGPPELKLVEWAGIKDHPAVYNPDAEDVAPRERPPIPVGAAQTHAYPADFVNLAARYVHYRFDAAGDARSVVFLDGATHRLLDEVVPFVPDPEHPLYVQAPVLRPPLSAAEAGVSIHALRRFGGEWWPAEDWRARILEWDGSYEEDGVEYLVGPDGWDSNYGMRSNRGVAILCRQVSAKRVEELVLITSFGTAAAETATWQAPADDPQIRTSTALCAETEMHEDWSADGRTLTRDVTFWANNFFAEPFGDGAVVWGVWFHVDWDAPVTWSVSYEDGVCSHQGGGTYLNTLWDLYVLSLARAPQSDRIAWVEPWGEWGTVTQTCRQPGEEPTTWEYTIGLAFPSLCTSESFGPGLIGCPQSRDNVISVPPPAEGETYDVTLRPAR